MNRWQQIERLFLEASDLPPAERAAYIARESDGDSELLAAVEGMLLHSGRGGTRFDQAIGAAAVSFATEPEPTQIDRYTIVRELGRGGMGAVYLAERAGQDFHQLVAIKVVKRGMDTGQIVERFRHERRILASLDHPNIARLFDGGATAGGVPYLVMEYVEGRPLLDHCRDLAIAGRLRLFLQICAGVQHAHQKLIVHRDIKPSNVLVTAGGTAKLLDFGIAKLLLSDETEAPSHTLTQAGMRLLTPDYASPEQIRGEPVSVATDVYSLGAVLYELLSGQRAHQFKNYTEAEFLRVICESEPTPVSQAVEDARTRRILSGDLDNIVDLALRKDPARRYASVEQFAADIRNYLDGLPVLARRETFFYRTGKFVKRNRVVVAASFLLLVTLSGGIVATTLQARRAERRFQQVRKLANTVVFEIYDGMANVPGTAQLRAGVVATALEYLDSLASEAEGEAALQTELAAAYKRIGDVQGNPSLSGLGQMPAALASYEKASAILNRLGNQNPPDPKVLADLANLERTIGFIRLNAGDAPRALEHQRRSIAAWERRNPHRGQDLTADTGIAQAWGYMGNALIAMGEPAKAVERHSAAVGVLRGWITRQAAPTTAGTLSLMLQDLADAQRETGDLRAAVATYREATRIRQEILQKNLKSLPFRRRLFTLNFALATLHGNPLNANLGDQKAAEAYAAEALRAAEAIAVEDKGSIRSIRDRMFGNWVMGCVLLPGEARRARPHLETALELASEQLRVDSSDALYLQSHANSQEALARALFETGERRRALELLRQAAETMERLSAKSPQMIDYRYDLIRTWNTLGDALPPADAGEFYQKAYQAAAVLPAGDRNVWEILSRANVNLRWPRWNTTAPGAERRAKLEIAEQSWQKLATNAPGNRAVQATLAEVRRELKMR